METKPPLKTAPIIAGQASRPTATYRVYTRATAATVGDPIPVLLDERFSHEILAVQYNLETDGNVANRRTELQVTHSRQTIFGFLLRHTVAAGQTQTHRITQHDQAAVVQGEIASIGMARIFVPKGGGFQIQLHDNQIGDDITAIVVVAHQLAS